MTKKKLLIITFTGVLLFLNHDLANAQFSDVDPTHPYSQASINSANEAQIDQLQLSANTKANMHAEVAAGNTILTPDKFIEDGTWRGILYVSLRPDWTAQYAIGEQVGTNGGWTVDGFQIMLVLIDGQQVARFINQGSNDNFVFADKEGGAGNPMGNDMKCRISRADFLDISNNTGWDIQYGLPCTKGTANFGTIAHTYILATDGAKFFSPGQYGYWAKESAILTQIDQYIQAKQALPAGDRDKLVVAERYPLRFSPKTGTYLQELCSQLNSALGHTWCPDIKNQTVYYIPYQNGSTIGRVFRAKEGFLQKLSEDDNALISLLGFPQSDEQVKTSPYATTGVQQDFVNGQLFWDQKKVYYTYGRIKEEHNRDSGIIGDLGFPQSDPVEINGYIDQIFEGDKAIELNLNTGVLQRVVSRKYRCELYGDVEDSFYLNLIMARGILDTGLQTLDDLRALIIPILEGLDHPIESYEAASALVNELEKVDWNDVKKFLKETANIAKQALAAEYEASLGPNGCSARSFYLAGRMTGEALLILIPASQLKAVTKVRALNVVKDVKFAKFIGAWFKYKSEIERILSGLVRPGRFEISRIKHVILGEFDDVTEAFLGGGLHSAKTLKNAMDNGIIEVWDASGIGKISRYEDIAVNAKGIREIKIMQKNGKLIDTAKSIFPDTWNEEDIISAIMEAADNNFPAIITKKGLTIKIDGYKNASGLIETAYPVFAY